jgi:hypothetical protein
VRVVARSAAGACWTQPRFVAPRPPTRPVGQPGGAAGGHAGKGDGHGG